MNYCAGYTGTGQQDSGRCNECSSSMKSGDFLNLLSHFNTVLLKTDSVPLS
jgi:hypothetical protein